jgi:hypothetical protein
MKTVKDFNNISEKLKAEIPVLAPEQVATFQMLNGRPNPDDDDKKKNPMLFGKKQLQTQFRIFDKYKKDSTGKEVGGYVDIVLAEDWVEDKPTKSKMYVAGFGDGFFTGKFDLVGGRIEDEELYEVLMLSPEREGSPCPNKSIQPLFKLVDFKKEAEKKTKDLTKFRRAVDLAISINADDAAVVLRSINRSYTDADERIAAVGELARTNPDLFLTIYDDPQKATKATLKEAMEAGIIGIDAKGVVSMGTETLTTIKTKDGVELLEKLTSWVNSAQNGKDVFDLIKKQLQPTMA